MTTSPTALALASLPPHLRRHVVAQDYGAYTPRDHAVWRHVLRRLVPHLAPRAHPAYLRGLEATGIGTERIPSMDEMNEKLSRLGWSAVPVRGFIPPAAFTELQALRVLAIAADIRTHEHLEYTPAPDIIHESAGHAPILADAEYGAFLQSAGELGFRAIASVEDEEAYLAIRALSVAKEDPAATPAEVRAAERRLEQAAAARRFVSEATRASRLYWWTAEYGLVGSLDQPRIYGAGLLSSLGESTHCLSDRVRRLPLDVGAADVEYDITRMQPQLFVALDFGHLADVAERLARTLSWRRGGDHGLEQARAARTVNHLVLDDGTALTGIVEALHHGPRPSGPGLATALAALAAPTLLSRRGRALGPISELPALVAFGASGSPPDGKLQLSLPNGLLLSGRVAGGVASELRARIGSRELDVPPRALLLLSEGLPSVSGGPGDPGAWDERFGAPAADPDAEARARAHKASALPARLADLYREARAQRESGRIERERLRAIAGEARRFPDDWLLRAEVEELLGEP